jgi:hypothetical protein
LGQLARIPPEKAYLTVDSEGIFDKVALVALGSKKEVCQFLQYVDEHSEGLFIVSCFHVFHKPGDTGKEFFLMGLIGLFYPGFMDKKFDIILEMD